VTDTRKLACALLLKRVRQPGFIPRRVKVLLGVMGRNGVVECGFFDNGRVTKAHYLPR
jgi:hypothetical protein